MFFFQMFAREELVETQVMSGFRGHKSLEAAPCFFSRMFVREEIAEVQVKFGSQGHGSLEAAPWFFFFPRCFQEKRLRRFK